MGKLIKVGADGGKPHDMWLNTDHIVMVSQYEKGSVTSVELSKGENVIVNTSVADIVAAFND